MKTTGDQKRFDFWQDHSRNYLEMAYQMDKRERLQDPAGYGKRTGVCGDTIEMFLMVEKGLIRTASFDTDGCLNTHACANTVVKMIEGKTIAAAWRTTVEDVIDFLGTLPPAEIHCAELAVGALYLALTDQQKMKQAPWKKIYKKHG